MTTKASQVDETALARLVPLGALPAQARQDILAQSQVENVSAGRYLFREGDTDNDAVYLVAGEVQFFTEGKLVSAARGGTADTRFPLDPAKPRTQSAKASGSVTLLRVDRSVIGRQLTWFQTAEGGVEGVTPGQARDWTSRLARSSLFTHIPSANIHKVFSRMESVPVRKGDLIIEQGAKGDYYYIVEQGRCTVTRRPSAEDPEIRLAELEVGDGFGEQAFLSEARHSATVTMVTDGTLRRLAKDAFLSMIKSPALHTVDTEKARTLAREGALWLDVRLPEEYKESGIPDSKNIPLASLPGNTKKLAKNRKYLVYCDSGERSSAAVSLLSRSGFDAYVVEDGLSGLKGAPTSQTAAVLGRDSAAAGKSVPTLEADITASRLQVALAQAKQDVEDAAHRRIEREAAIRAAVEEAERLRSQGSTADNSVTAEIEKRLKSEQERYKAELARADESLREAQRARGELEAAKKAAEDEAIRQRTAAKQAREDLKKKLHEGKRQLEAEYARASRTLEELERKRAKTQSLVEKDREKLESKVTRAGKRLAEVERERDRAQQAYAEAQQALSGLEARAQEQLADLKEREDTLRAQAQEDLRQGRAKLETEFARNLQLLEQARREQEKAEAAKRAAEEEAARIAEQAKRKREQIRKEAETRLRAERQRLKREATEINAQLDAARRMKEQAEAAHRAAMERAEKLRTKQAAKQQSAVDEAAVKAEIKRREEEVLQAHEEEEAARKARMDVEVSQKIAERTEVARENAQKRLAAELNAWVDEEKERESTQRRQASRIEEGLKRLNERMAQALKEEEEANKEMFDEITTQLHPGKR